MKHHIVNTFSKNDKGGSTCAVYILEEWLDDAELQEIAIKHSYPETAFVRINKNNAKNPDLRWFTVSQEVSFCGYGSLSAAQVYLKHVTPDRNSIVFNIRNNDFPNLEVSKEGDVFNLRVPAQPPLKENFDDAVAKALRGRQPEKMFITKRGDLLVVYKDTQDLQSNNPDYEALIKCGYYGYILTAPSEEVDYNTIYISPRMTDVWVDPANGASQATLAVYWSEELGKDKVRGCSLTRSGGNFYCSYTKGEKFVTIGGQVSPA